MWEDTVNVQHTIGHMPYVTRVGHFAKYVAVNRPNSKLAAHGSNLMQELSMYSHGNTIKNSIPTCTAIKVHERATEPGPTIAIQISSSTGTHSLNVLPDSGADICAKTRNNPTNQHFQYKALQNLV